MKKLLAAFSSFLIVAGSFLVTPAASAQNASVAAACSAQSLPVGYLNGTLIVKQNGDLCTNASGGGGGGASVTATAAAPTYVEGSTNNNLSSTLKGAVRFIPNTPAGANIDLSQPSTLVGADGTTILSNANPFPTSLQTAIPAGANTIGAISNTSFAATQATAANLNATVVGSGPVSNGTAQAGSLLAGGVYNSTQPTLTTGQQAGLQVGSRGALQVQVMLADGVTTQALLTAGSDGDSNARAGFYSYARGELFNGATWDRTKSIAASFGTATGVAAVEQAGASFSHISTSTTTTAKSGAGILHKIIVNTGGTTNVATVYDNTAGSGTVIAVIDGSTKGDLAFDLAFATGLTIVTAGGTPADYTIVYR